MAAKIRSIFFCLLLPFGLQAQDLPHRWNLSAAACFPTGRFSETHWIGAGLALDYAPRRMGKLPALPPKKWGWILSSGLNYVAGKKETAGGYSFRYGDYTVLNLYGGTIFHPVKNVHIRLLAGPAGSYYRENLRFNLGSELGINWYFRPQWGIGSSIGIIKETGARSLWMTGIRGNYAF